MEGIIGQLPRTPLAIVSTYTVSVIRLLCGYYCDINNSWLIYVGVICGSIMKVYWKIDLQRDW